MSGLQEYFSPRIDPKSPYDDHGEDHSVRSSKASDQDQASAHSCSRDVTWISTSQITSQNHSIIPGPPPSAFGGPSQAPTVMPPGGLVSSEELEAEYMTVDPEEDFSGWNDGRDLQSQWHKRGPKNFVGGFVNGLKRLPRIVLHKPLRGHTEGTVEPVNTSPIYNSPILTRQSEPGALYVEASEMPARRPVPVLFEADSDHSDGGSYHSRHIDERSHHTDDQSHRTHTDAVSRYTYMGGRSRHTDDQSQHISRHDHVHDTHPEAHSTQDAPYDYAAGETTLGHIPGPAADRSPEPVDFVQSLNNGNLEIPLHPSSSMSLNSRFVRLGQFFRDLYDLPWVATRITVDYIPGEHTRGKYGRQARTTWYPDQQYPVDLLAGERATSPHRKYSVGHNNHAYMPSSRTIPIYHSDRRDVRRSSPSHDRHRSQSPPYSQYAPAPQYPFFTHGYTPEYAAQPLYVYPSIVPPVHPTATKDPNSVNSEEQRQAHVEMEQARPVYMMAPSSPFPFMPPPPDQAHALPRAYYPYPMFFPPAVYPS
jgi:hypothetical protein